MARSEPPQRGRSAAVRRALRRALRRVPSRTVLLIAFGFAIAAVGLATYPFNVASDSGTTLQCGPALFEVIIPSDPAFDVAENTECNPGARQRLVLSGALLSVGLLAAVITELRARHGTRVAHGRWLQGPRRRRGRRRGHRRGSSRGSGRGSSQGSTSLASSAAKASAAAAVSGPGHAGSD